MESKMNAPLSGVKILDLTTVVMGPFATQILSELGADVVKVETLDGDNVRHIGPMKNDEMGYLFLSLNRGKRSLAIDLKNARGKEAILKIIPSFDVLIYNIETNMVLAKKLIMGVVIMGVIYSLEIKINNSN